MAPLGRGIKLLVAIGLDQARGRVTIGLVADDVGAYKVGRQEHNAMIEATNLAAPGVARPAGLERHRSRWVLGEELKKVRSANAPASRHDSRPLGYGDLKDVA